jgi:hypothetical protein
LSSKDQWQDIKLEGHLKSFAHWDVKEQIGSAVAEPFTFHFRFEGSNTAIAQKE